MRGTQAGQTAVISGGNSNCSSHSKGKSEGEDVSVSRVSAVMASWFVAVLPMHARRMMRGSTVAVRAATGGGTTRVMMYGAGRASGFCEKMGMQALRGEWRARRAKRRCWHRPCCRESGALGDLSSVDLFQHGQARGLQRFSGWRPRHALAHGYFGGGTTCLAKRPP